MARSRSTDAAWHKVTGQLRDLPDEVKAAVVEQIRTDMRRIPGSAKSRASSLGRMSRRASGVVSYSDITDGGRIDADGGGLGGHLFKGTEYGARGNKKTTYARRSPRGRVHVVRRRTTRMFRRFVGTAGYWYWPSVRKDLKGIIGRSYDVIEKEANRLG